ncbi:TrbI/VirB10 family protein [Aurantiacibacter sp. MUD61]|uniref:TrbI/VirB10 family protein n=1 Tax=Aurantiacibacter sp. MUD61 TaxID=3009083 RepID=UPI0022F1441B|nr:TrbI/VirB10 family protein [Aurantiacibacter sp. MUD61]
MKLAMRMPEKGTGTDTDPREAMDTEVIDLASRTSYPVVANRNPRSDALGLAAGIGFVGLLGAAVLWGLSSSRLEDENAQAAGQVDQAAPPPVMVGGTPTDGLPSANAVAAEVPAPVAAPGAVLAPAPGPGFVGSPAPAGNPYNSPALVFDGSAAPAANGAGVPAGAAVPAAADTGTVPGAGGAGEFAARIGGVGGGPASATQDFNPATTVTQGTMIPAILETAINTDVPGYVRAVVSQDVRSHDGARVLIPRSSRLVGQYQSGLQAGQRRAYVIWERVIRPDGVSVQLRSPATSFDGTAGLEGDVNNHFFSRFGSAMLLSVIGGLTTVASGGASVVLGGGQSAASTALQQDGQRPPTIRVRMGEPIRVYTARDLDFGSAPAVR